MLIFWQIFRGLRVPITSRMLTDILSRLVETTAEQGEDMQGYVTELSVDTRGIRRVFRNGFPTDGCCARHFQIDS